MYDYSGEWARRVDIPAKSGVGAGRGLQPPLRVTGTPRVSLHEQRIQLPGGNDLTVRPALFTFIFIPDFTLSKLS
jgi:hypothetical protein